MLLACAIALVLLGSAGCTEEETFPSGPPSTQATTSSVEATSTTTSTEGGGGGGGTSDGPAPVTPEPVRLRDVDPALMTDNFVQCPDCHALLDQPGATSPAIVASFSHGFHFEQGAKCVDCHATPTHTEEGIKPPPMDKCFSCHSQSDPAAPPGDCAACHPADFPLVPSSHDDPEWLPVADLRATVEGKHTRSVEDAQKECSVCHDVPGFCMGCHKTEMPHPADWQNVHQQEAKEQGLTGCNFCHTGQQECSACHHTGYEPGGTPWVEMHPSVIATEGVQPCISCHSTKTCAHCHVTGEYREYE